MKKLKKILLGLSLSLSFFLLFFGFQRAVLAAEIPIDLDKETAFFSEPNTTYTVTEVVNNQPKTIVMKSAGKSFTFEDRTPSDTTYNLKHYGTTGFVCGGAEINHSGKSQPRPNGNTGWVGEVFGSHSRDTDKECDEGSGEFFIVRDIAMQTSSASDTGGPEGSADTCGSVATCINLAQTGDSSACSTNSNTAMEWLLCPLTTAISKFADVINGQVENQLNFRTDDFLPDGGQVHRAWTIIKNIVSGLVVILLLVMVISQAVGGGGGLFDAYTVKKVLPKLVIAIIAMQFSWELSQWVISTVNDIGVGIKQILLAPFGGGGEMDLSSILNRLHPTYAIATNYPLVALVILFVVKAPEFILPVLIFAFTAVAVGLITAFASLVFRNMLIIMAVIFSPLALLLWAAPGQTMQSYWKRYTDNFLRLLMLFPLMIVMIYAGRIAAWVTGNIGEPGIVDYFVVLICFFLPYFYLPKAFKWGGQIMAGINNAIATNKILGAGRNWGYGNAKRGWEDAKLKGAAAFNSSEEAKSRWNPNSKFGRGLQRIPIARGLLYKKDKASGEWLGRRKPLDQQRVNLMKAGRVIDSETNRRDVEALGKQYKGRTDEALDEGLARPAEAARQGKQSAYALIGDPEGELGDLDSESFPEKEDANYGWDAYWSAMMRHAHNGDWRAMEGLAKKAFTHPEFAIYGNRPMALDPNNKLWKTRVGLEEEYGLQEIGDYDEDKMNSSKPEVAEKYAADKKWTDRRHELREKKRNLREGEELSDPEKVELDKLNMLWALRRGNHKAYTKDEIKNMKKTIRYLKKNRDWALKRPKNGVLSNYNADGTEKDEKEQIYFTTLAEMYSTQKKSSSTTEVNSGVKQINPLAQVDLTTRQLHKGWKPVPNIDRLPHLARAALTKGPQSEEAQQFREWGMDPANLAHVVDSGKFNQTDEQGWLWSDKVAAETVYNANESFWGWVAGDNAEALSDLHWGYQTYNNLGQGAGDDGLTLLPGLAGVHWFTSGIMEREDQNVTQVLTKLLQTPSTKLPFRKWLQKSVPSPKDAIRFANDVLSDPAKAQFIPQALNNIKVMYKVRRACGIDDDDTRPLTERDLRIMEETKRYQYYYPGWTAKHTRFLFDQKKDRANRAAKEEFTPPPDLDQRFRAPAADPTLAQSYGEIGEYIDDLMRGGQLTEEIMNGVTRAQEEGRPLDDETVRHVIERIQPGGTTRQGATNRATVPAQPQRNQPQQQRQPPGFDDDDLDDGGGGGSPSGPRVPRPRPQGPAAEAYNARVQAAWDARRVARQTNNPNDQLAFTAAKQSYRAVRPDMQQVRNAERGIRETNNQGVRDLLQSQIDTVNQRYVNGPFQASGLKPGSSSEVVQAVVDSQEFDPETIFDIQKSIQGQAPAEVDIKLQPAAPATVNVRQPAGFRAFETKAQAVPGATPMPTVANPVLTPAAPVQRPVSGGGAGSQRLGGGFRPFGRPEYEPGGGAAPTATSPPQAQAPTNTPVEDVVTIAGKKRTVSSQEITPREIDKSTGVEKAQFGKPSENLPSQRIKGADVVYDETGQILVPAKQETTSKGFVATATVAPKKTGGNLEALAKRLTAAEGRLAKAREAGEITAINKELERVKQLSSRFDAMSAEPSLTSHPAALERRIKNNARNSLSKREFANLTQELQAAEADWYNHSDTPNSPDSARQAQAAKLRMDQIRARIQQKVRDTDPGWTDTPELKGIAEQVHLSSKEMVPYTGGPPELKVDHSQPSAVPAKQPVKPAINPDLQKRLTKFKEVQQATDAEVLEGIMSEDKRSTEAAIINAHEQKRAVARMNPSVAGPVGTLPGPKPLPRKMPEQVAETIEAEAAPSISRPSKPVSDSRAPERTAIEEMMDEEIERGRAERRSHRSEDDPELETVASKAARVPVGTVGPMAAPAPAAPPPINVTTTGGGSVTNITYSTVQKGSVPVTAMPVGNKGPATSTAPVNNNNSQKGNFSGFDMNSAAGKKFMSELSHRMTEQLNQNRKPGEKEVSTDSVRKHLEGSMK